MGARTEANRRRVKRGPGTPRGDASKECVLSGSRQHVRGLSTDIGSAGARLDSSSSQPGASRSRAAPPPARNDLCGAISEQSRPLKLAALAYPARTAPAVAPEVVLSPVRAASRAGRRCSSRAAAARCRARRIPWRCSSSIESFLGGRRNPLRIVSEGRKDELVARGFCELPIRAGSWSCCYRVGTITRLRDARLAERTRRWSKFAAVHRTFYMRHGRLGAASSRPRGRRSALRRPRRSSQAAVRRGAGHARTTVAVVAQTSRSPAALADLRLGLSGTTGIAAAFLWSALSGTGTETTAAALAGGAFAVAVRSCARVRSRRAGGDPVSGGSPHRRSGDGPARPASGPAAHGISRGRSAEIAVMELRCSVAWAKTAASAWLIAPSSSSASSSKKRSVVRGCVASSRCSVTTSLTRQLLTALC